MTIKLGMLAGVIRPIPDVMSFLTPVFLGSDDNYYVQDVERHMILGFTKVSVGDEFQELSSRYAVRIGDRALYGFEKQLGQVIISCALGLAEFLQSEETISFRALKNLLTKKAVVRFCESMQHAKEMENSRRHPVLHFEEGVGVTTANDLLNSQSSGLLRENAAGGDKLVEYMHDLIVEGNSEGSLAYYFENSGRNLRKSSEVDIVSEWRELTVSSQRLWRNYEKFNSAYLVWVLHDHEIKNRELVSSISRIKAEVAKQCAARMQEAAKNLIVLSGDLDVSKNVEKRHSVSEWREKLNVAYNEAIISTDDVQKTVRDFETRVGLRSIGH